MNALEPPAPVAVDAASPAVADGQRRSLDPRTVVLDRITSGIVTVCLSGGAWMGAVIVYFAGDLPRALFLLLLLACVALTVLLTWLTFRWPEIEYRHTSYRVDAQGIEIARGVLFRSIVNVPGSRVQHTDVSQGPLERRLGLGTLTIFTAGTEFARVDLPGLAHPTALAVRDHLLPKRSDDGV
jgi:uncharacterized protein